MPMESANWRLAGCVDWLNPQVVPVSGLDLPLEVGPVEQDARDFREVGGCVPRSCDGHGGSVGVRDAGGPAIEVQPAAAEAAEQKVRLVVHDVDVETLRLAETEGGPEAFRLVLHVGRYVRGEPRQALVQFRIWAERGGGDAFDRGTPDGGESSRVCVFDLWVPVTAFLPVIQETQPLQRDLADSRVGQFVPERFFVEDRVGGSN